MKSQVLRFKGRGIIADYGKTVLRKVTNDCENGIITLQGMFLQKS